MVDFWVDLDQDDTLEVVVSVAVAVAVAGELAGFDYKAHIVLVVDCRLVLAEQDKMSLNLFDLRIHFERIIVAGHTFLVDETAGIVVLVAEDKIASNCLAEERDIVEFDHNPIELVRGSISPSPVELERRRLRHIEVACSAHRLVHHHLYVAPPNLDHVHYFDSCYLDSVVHRNVDCRSFLARHLLDRIGLLDDHLRQILFHRLCR
jgi:hypothetical protein